MKTGITFRQLIQSLKDYTDPYATVMIYAKDAEDPCWGIDKIWFEDNVLMIGQHDDEGNVCSGIIEDIESCLPIEQLDQIALVKVGVAYCNGNEKQIINAFGKPAHTYKVGNSEVKRWRKYDDDHCKWILKLKK